MAGSFWSNFGLRFNATSSSNGIDELLERGEGHFTLQEVLLHDQCIQEAKYMNQQLCDYLAQPAVVAQLVRYVVTVPPEARQPKGAAEAGGGIDSGGGITTAASLKIKADKAKAAIAAAQQANQSSETDAAGASKSATAESASPSGSDSTADATTDAASDAATADSDSARDQEDEEEEEEARAKADAESSDSFSHHRGHSSGSDSDSDAEPEESEEARAARAAEIALENEQKFPYLASELFACEVPAMLDAIFEDGESMSRRSSVASANGGAGSRAALGQVDENEAEGDEAAKATADEEGAADAASPTAASTSPTAAAAAVAAAAASDLTTVSSPSSSSSTGPRRLPILDLLLSFLDQPAPIDPAHASYFRKVMVVLIQRKYDPLVRYMAAHGTLDKLLRHIGLHSLLEIVIMIGWDDGLGGNQDVAWLVEADLTGKLIDKLKPIADDDGAQTSADAADASADASVAALAAARAKQDREEGLINASRALVDVVVKCPASSHNPLITRLLATPCLTQLFAHMFSGAPLSLSNALSIIIVLVQRYANRMDLGEAIMDEAKAAALAQQAASLDAPDDDDAAAAAANAAAAAAAAASSHASGGDDNGGPRLAEPFHSLVPHLSRILRLLDTEVPPVVGWSYGSGRAFGETRLKVVELILVLVRCKVAEVESCFVAERLMHKLLDAFFNYPWNNMLHGLVESIIRTTLEFLPADTPLKPALFLDAQLAQRVMAAYDANVEACKAGAGFRLGYMGHLLRTADVIEHYLKQREAEAGEGEGEGAQSCRERILGSAETAAAWSTFVSGPLAAENEAQRVVMPSMGGGMDDDDFDDHDAMGDMSAFQQHAEQHKSAGDSNDADFAFDPDGEGGADGYDYGAHAGLDGVNADGEEWANFNTHFADAPMGAGFSPNQQQQAQHDDDDEFEAERPVSSGSGAGAASLSSPAAQRKLLEFSLNPDEDADSVSSDELTEMEENGDDWANFDSPAAAATTDASVPPAAATTASTDDSAAASATTASTNAGGEPAASAPEASTTTAAAADDEDFSDFAVEFPPAQ